MTPQLHNSNRVGAIATLGLVALLSGCADDPGPAFDTSKPLADGVYTSQSSLDEKGGKGVITITVASGKIVDAEFHGINSDGSLKDESYGKDSSGQVTNERSYAKAQFAVAQFEMYALDLLKVGNPNDVDVIAGATWAHKQFLEASIAALEQAQTKAS
ncbi:MAG: FMN-binding protein [Propionibacteriaceae bacterium]|jgi:major membrane immunogen (membrane-anchored lipoprotein)|nr:FMN-binding protein [Propionibacteriaceae bacterium]